MTGIEWQCTKSETEIQAQRAFWLNTTGTELPLLQSYGGSRSADISFNRNMQPIDELCYGGKYLLKLKSI